MLGAGRLERDQTHRIVWVGKDLEKTASQTPCSEQGHLQLHQDRMQPLEIPGEGYQERDEVPEDTGRRILRDG